MGKASEYRTKDVFYNVKTTIQEMYTFSDEYVSVEEFALKEEMKGKIIFSDKYTIVILNGRHKGVAKCHPNDEFNPRKSVKIAYARALVAKAVYEASE